MKSLRKSFSIKSFISLTISLLLSLSVLCQEWQVKMTDPSVNIFEVKQDFEEYWTGRPKEKGKGFKQFKRWEHFMEPRCYPTGVRFSPDKVNSVRSQPGSSSILYARAPGGGLSH